MFSADNFRDIEDAAAKLANNHDSFKAFAWHDRPEDKEKWAIVYTHNRDSDLLELSNASVVDREMGKPEFEQDVMREHHGHWGVGWVDGWAVRVYDGAGAITPVFQALWELAVRLAGYPLLDESDHSEREWTALMESIELTGSRFIREGAPEDWASLVYNLLPEREKENRDGQGASPSDDSVKAALAELGFLADED